MVDLEPVVEDEDLERLKSLIQEHFDLTGSSRARMVLGDWDSMVSKFVKIFPRDFRRVLRERKEREEQELAVHG